MNGVMKLVGTMEEKVVMDRMQKKDIMCLQISILRLAVIFISLVLLLLSLSLL